MKKRIISALVGLCVLAVAIALYDTVALPIFLAVLAAIAAYELLHACGCLEARLFCAVVVAVAAVTAAAPGTVVCGEFFAAAVFVLLVCWLRWHGRLTAQQMGFSAGAAVLIALSFRFILTMRDEFGHAAGLYALMVTLVAAWMSDTGAYFGGRLFGRHKLCPHISPNKTIEGAVGGVVGALIGQALLAVIFMHIYALQIRLGVLLVCSPFLTAVSIVGDLSASVIKRDTGIKDYGNIMPGHGGVLDRFDSVLPLIPIVYYLLTRLIIL